MIEIDLFTLPAYMPPLGTPAYWMDEQTGVLREALHRYLADAATPEQLALVIQYLRYVINAPCWRDNDGELARLRSEADQLATVADVRRWIGRCLPIGIDPI